MVSGKNVFRKGWIQERVDSRKEGCMKGGMTEGRDALKEGCRKGKEGVGKG